MKNQNCELCGSTRKITKHHLIPKRVSRSTKYPKELKTNNENFLYLCEFCHSQLHALYTEQELRDFYYTKDLLLVDEKIMNFVKWRQKHPDFKGSSKMSNNRKRK